MENDLNRWAKNPRDCIQELTDGKLTVDDIAAYVGLYSKGCLFQERFPDRDIYMAGWCYYISHIPEDRRNNVKIHFAYQYIIWTKLFEGFGLRDRQVENTVKDAEDGI